MNASGNINGQLGFTGLQEGMTPNEHNFGTSLDSFRSFTTFLEQTDNCVLCTSKATLKLIRNG